MTVQDEEGLEQQVIKLKKKLFVSEEKNEALEHELQLLRQIKSDLQHILIDDVDEIRFTDTLALEAYEKEERILFNEFKQKLYHLKSRYKADSTELCPSCIGQLLEI